MGYTFVNQGESEPTAEKGYTFAEEKPKGYTFVEDEPKKSVFDDVIKYGGDDLAIHAHQEDQARVAAYIPTVKKTYSMANKQIEIGRLGDKWMEGKISDIEIDRINILGQEIFDISRSIKEKPYEARAAAQLIPFVQNAVSKGGKNYLIGSTIGMVTAATVGMAIPGSEEALTIPAAGHAIGSLFGTFAVAEDMRKIEGGNAYIELRQSGVDPEIAKWAGRTYGMGSALLEVYQLKLFAKLFPGAKNVAPKIITNAVNKVLKGRLSKSALAKAGGKHVLVTTGEATVEASQQLLENIIATAAKEYQDYAKGTDISPEGMAEQWKAIKNGIAESFATTFVGVGILSLPSIGVNFVSDTVAGKKEFKRIQDTKLRTLEEQEETTDVVEEGAKDEVVVETPVVEEEEAVVVETPTKEEVTTTPETVVVPPEPEVKVEKEIVPPHKVDKPVIKETKKVKKEKEKKVKFNQSDLTKPAIRLEDGTIYRGTEFSGSWTVSKPQVAVKEGTKAFGEARKLASQEGKSLDNHDQGFMIGDEFVSTDMVAEKFSVLEKVAKKKAARIAKQGEAEGIALLKEKIVKYKASLKGIRDTTEQDVTTIKEVQPTVRKAVNSWRNLSPALSQMFTYQSLVNAANEGVVKFILQTHKSDVDAFVQGIGEGKNQGKIKGGANIAATFALKNHVKKQLGTKQGKTRDRISKELKARTFRDTIQADENKTSSVKEAEREVAIEDAHEAGDTAPVASKSKIKIEKRQTDKEAETKIKSTAGKVKKISVKKYLADKKKAEAARAKVEKKGLVGAKEKFAGHRATKLSKKDALSRKERQDAQQILTKQAAALTKTPAKKGSSVITLLDNERGETTILGEAASKIIDGYEAIAKKLSVEAAWKKYPAIGRAMKAIFSVQTMEQQKGMDVVKDFIKVVKESHKGYKITRKDLGEIVLSAEDPKYLDVMAPTKKARIKPGADFLSKYFKDSQKELSDKGIEVDFNKRMLADLEHRLEKEEDADRSSKISEQIKIIKRIQFIHIPVQMWTMNKTKQLIAARSKREFEKKYAELKLTLIKERRAVSLGSLVAKKTIALEKINPMEIILNYANKKGQDFSITNIRDAAVADGLIKHQKTKPKGAKEWVKIPERLAALSISGKPQGWVQAGLINTIDDTISSVQMQSKFDKTIAITKMAAFYNPFFLPAYDLVQFGMLGPMRVHQIPGVMVKAIKDVTTRTEDYYLAEKNGTFSKPFALPFAKWKSTAEKMTTETTSGWYVSQFGGMLEQMFNVKSGSFLKPIYQASWTTAWFLDEVIRMMSFNYLTKRGHSATDAAQTAAKFHGDYAGVPASTRKALNRFFFTPTFKIAMGGLWAHMLKNVVKTVGGTRKKGTTKMERRLAYGAMCTFGINLGFHLVMTQMLGFEDDQWGRRYVKKVYTKEGPKEIVITWSTPANIALKYIYRINEAMKPGVANPLLALWNSNRWELHPVYRAFISVVSNKRAGGEEIWNENDDKIVILKKGIDYITESIVGMYSGVKMMTGKHGGTYSTRQARELLSNEWGMVWKYFFQHFAFAYMRDVKDKREGQKIKAMVRRAKQAISKSERETKTHDRVWEKNLMEKIKDILGR